MDWLLLRGLVRERRHWGDFPERLAARTGGSVRTLDLPGVGTERHRPSPTTIDAIVDDLRARHALRGGGLMAPSLGGMIALRWAERHPEDFDRVVVCNTSARDLAGPLQRFSPVAVWTALTGLMTRDRVARERRILRLVSSTGERHAETFASYAIEAPIPPRVLVRQLWAASRARAPQALGVPLLVLASDGDRLCSPIASRRLAERLGAPIAVHPSAGHDLPLDDPDWVIEQMVQAS